jgi:hydroxymethylglutaryl-CoA lyase
MPLPSQVHVIDVGPRDGLQNEAQIVPTHIKAELVQRLQSAGLRHIEVTSFVRPQRVPQMADNAQLMAALQRHPGVVYSVLVPNMQGFDAALPTRPDEIVVFGAASEAFSQRNIQCSIAHSIERFAPVVAAALAVGIRVRAAMSCCAGCPYEGDIAPERVAYLAGLLRGIGVQQVSVADTIGTGTPRQVQAAIEATLRHYDISQVNGHFHDTYGQALANTLVALQMGVTQFEASVAGLGGCPFAQGATGNLATEDLVYMLQGMGMETGIDLDQLVDAGQFINQFLQRPSQSRAATALAKRRGVTTQS